MPRRKKGELPSGNVRVQVLAYTDEKGKRHYQSFTAPTRTEALALAEAFKKGRKSCFTDMTVNDAVNRYINAKASVLAPSTIKNHKIYEKNYFRGDFGAEHLKTLTNAQIQVWISDLVSKGLSVKTISNARGLLAVTLGMFMPDFRINVSMPKKKKEAIHCPSPIEVQTAFDVCTDKYLKVAMVLAGTAGTRKGEICAVCWEDYDGEYLDVNKAYSQNEFHEWILKEPKTFSSNRSIKLCKYAIKTLDSLKDEHTGQIIKKSPASIASAFQRLMIVLEAVGVQHFRFHDLRHFAASIAHTAASKRYVESFGGWTPGSDVMERTYDNVIDVEKVKADKAIADKFDELFG